MCESQGQPEFFYVDILTVMFNFLGNISTLQTVGQIFFIV
jgi:hypothetical protein